MTTLGVTAPKRSPQFFALPTTSLGKWSARLFVIALLLTLALNLVVLPARLPEMIENAAGLTVFLGFLATGLTALVAIVRERERSWTAFLSIVAMLFVVAMNVGPLLFGE